MTSESYIDADEIYYAYYMKHISGPWTAESRDWLTAQGEEFAPMLAVQRRVARGELSSEAMLPTAHYSKNTTFTNRSCRTTSTTI